MHALLFETAQTIKIRGGTMRVWDDASWAARKAHQKTLKLHASASLQLRTSKFQLSSNKPEANA